MERNPEKVIRIYELKIEDFLKTLSLQGRCIQRLEARNGTVYIETNENIAENAIKIMIGQAFEEIIDMR